MIPFRKPNFMPTNMIDYLRIALYASLIVILLVLFQAWDKDHPKTVAATPIATTADNNYVPQIADNSSAAESATTSPPVINHTAALTSQKLIHITTDVIQVDISPVGGNIIQVKLLK